MFACYFQPMTRWGRRSRWHAAAAAAHERAALRPGQADGFVQATSAREEAAMAADFVEVLKGPARRNAPFCDQIRFTKYDPDLSWRSSRDSCMMGRASTDLRKQWRAMPLRRRGQQRLRAQHCDPSWAELEAALADMGVVERSSATPEADAVPERTRRSRKRARRRARLEARKLVRSLYGRVLLAREAMETDSAEAEEPKAQLGSEQGSGLMRAHVWKLKQPQRKTAKLHGIRHESLVRAPADGVPNMLAQRRLQVQWFSESLASIADGLREPQKRRCRKTHVIRPSAALLTAELPSVGTAFGRGLARRASGGLKLEFRKGRGGRGRGRGAGKAGAENTGPERTYRKAGQGTSCTDAGSFPPGSGYWQKDDLQKAKGFVDRQARGHVRAWKRCSARAKSVIEAAKEKASPADGAEHRGCQLKTDAVCVNSFVGAKARSVRQRRSVAWLDMQAKQWQCQVAEQLWLAYWRQGGPRSTALALGPRVSATECCQISGKTGSACAMVQELVQDEPFLVEGTYEVQGSEPGIVEELELEFPPVAQDPTGIEKAVPEQLEMLAEQEESKLRLQRQVLALAAKATMRRVGRRRVTCSRMRCRSKAREYDFKRQARRGRFSRKDPVIRRLRRYLRQQRKQAQRARRMTQATQDAGQSVDDVDPSVAVASLPEECGQFLCSACGETIDGTAVCFADEGALFQEPYHFSCLCEKGSWRPWCRFEPLQEFDGEPQSEVVYSSREYGGNKKLQRRRASEAGARAALAGGAPKKRRQQQPEQEQDGKREAEIEEVIRALEELARKLDRPPVEWNQKRRMRALEGLSGQEREETEKEINEETRLRRKIRQLKLAENKRVRAVLTAPSKSSIVRVEKVVSFYENEGRKLCRDKSKDEDDMARWMANPDFKDLVVAEIERRRRSGILADDEADAQLRLARGWDGRCGADAEERMNRAEEVIRFYQDEHKKPSRDGPGQEDKLARRMANPSFKEFVVAEIERRCRDGTLEEDEGEKLVRFACGQDRRQRSRLRMQAELERQQQVAEEDVLEEEDAPGSAPDAASSGNMLATYPEWCSPDPRLLEGLNVCVAEAAFAFAEESLANFGVITGAIFVAVQSHPEVSEAAFRCFQGYSLSAAFRRELRRAVRCVVETEMDTCAGTLRRSFYAEAEEDELVDVDVRRLLEICATGRCGAMPSEHRAADRRRARKKFCHYGSACQTDGGHGQCNGSQFRARAIRMLLKYFPEDALSAARAQGAAETEDGLLKYWMEILEAVETEGVRVCRSVCCESAVSVRLSLRPNGRARTMVPPLLPSFVPSAVEPGCLELSAETLEERRRVREDADGECGSRLFWLPADFLCGECLGEFRALDVQAASAADLSKWGKRLQLNEASRDARCLATQQKALALRDRLVHASAASEQEFERKLAEGWRQLSQSDVVRGLRREAHCALPPVLYRRGVGEQDVVHERSFFGVWPMDERGTRFYGLPLAFGDRPCTWSDYTGAPGYVRLDLFACRLLARVRGGFRQLSEATQVRLTDLEAAVDPCRTAYFVEGAWLLGMTLKPRGDAPHARVWRDVLQTRPSYADLCRVRDYIEGQRDARGVWHEFESWHHDSVRVLAAAQEEGELSEGSRELTLWKNFEFYRGQAFESRELALQALAAPGSKVAKDVITGWRRMSAQEWLDAALQSVRLPSHRRAPVLGSGRRAKRCAVEPPPGPGGAKGSEGSAGNGEANLEAGFAAIEPVSTNSRAAGSGASHAEDEASMLPDKWARLEVAFQSHMGGNLKSLYMDTLGSKSDSAYSRLHAAVQKANLQAGIEEFTVARGILREAVHDVLADCRPSQKEKVGGDNSPPAVAGDDALRERKATSGPSGQEAADMRAGPTTKPQNRCAKPRADNGAVCASSSSSGQQDKPESASSPGISRARSGTRQQRPKNANGNGHAEPNSVPPTGEANLEGKGKGKGKGKGEGKAARAQAGVAGAERTSELQPGTGAVAAELELGDDALVDAESAQAACASGASVHEDAGSGTGQREAPELEPDAAMGAAAASEMRSLSDEQLERTVAEVLEHLQQTHLTYDEKRGCFGEFLDEFRKKTEIYKHKNRAWTEKLRNVVRRVLGRQALSSMFLRVDGTKVNLEHASLRTVIADALKRFDLRLESVSTKDVRETVCSMLGISMEQLRQGLRYAVPDASPSDGREASDVSAAHDFTKLMLSVYMDLSDMAWHAFLFDASPDAGGCCARRKSGRLACAVLYKCGGAVRASSQASTTPPLCQQHFAEWNRTNGKLRLGIWLDAGNSVDDLHPNTAAALVKAAQWRAMRRPEDVPVEHARVAGTGFNAPALVRKLTGAGKGSGRGGTLGSSWWASARRSLRQRGRQPEFVDNVPGRLRQFETCAAALPPFPCRLCECDFGHRGALWAHVALRHGGVQEYRKRLWFEAAGQEQSVRSVTPQEWRLVAARASEELVTGTATFPACQVSFDDEGQLATQRRRLLGKLSAGIAKLGGLVAFCTALKLDAESVAGDAWREADAEDVLQQLLLKRSEIYRPLLVASSRRARSTRGDADAIDDLGATEQATLRCVIQAVRQLPLDEYWFDDGYILEALSSLREDLPGVKFSDRRLAPTLEELLGRGMREYVSDVPGGFSAWLRWVRSFERADDAGEVWQQVARAMPGHVQDWVAHKEDHERRWKHAVSLAASLREGSGLLWHSGAALLQLARLAGATTEGFDAVQAPPWAYPTADMPLPELFTRSSQGGSVELDEAEVASAASSNRRKGEGDVVDEPDGDISDQGQQEAQGPSGSRRRRKQDDPREKHLQATRDQYRAACQEASVYSQGRVPSLGDEASERRSAVRHRADCAVCARSHWSTELQQCYMFDAPEGRLHEALLRDGAVAVAGAVLGDGRQESRLEHARHWFSPERYQSRWKLPAAGGGLAKEVSIPLEELRASCVMDPIRKQPWLLHRKAFRVDENGVAVPEQKVPVCSSCRCALQGTRPRLPKYALANDLWMGKMPEKLRGLTPVAWHLLARARLSIRRYNCRREGGGVVPEDQTIKAIVGNVCAFPQADGGRVLMHMPPTAEDIVQRLQICFTDKEKNLERARVQELRVDTEKMKAAYDYLHEHNVVYQKCGVWSRVNADDLTVRKDEDEKEKDEDDSTLPPAFRAAVLSVPGADSQVGQQGPAEAVASVPSPLPEAQESVGRSVGAEVGSRELESLSARAKELMRKLVTWVGARVDAFPRAEFDLDGSAEEADQALEQELSLRSEIVAWHEQVARAGTAWRSDLRFALSPEALYLEARLRQAVVRRVALWRETHDGEVPRGRQDFDEHEKDLTPEAKEEISLHASLCACDSVFRRLAHAFRNSGPVNEDSFLDAACHGERDEYVAAMPDDQVCLDVERQWKQVEFTFRKALAEMEANLLKESQNATGGSEAASARREWIERSLAYLREFAEKQDPDNDDLQAQAERANSEVERTVLCPGKAAGSEQLEAELQAEDPEGVRFRRLIVPSATAPQSMFDAYFWPLVFPWLFPFGDGGLGVERDVPVSNEEYNRYMLQRSDLEYPDPPSISDEKASERVDDERRWPGSAQNQDSSHGPGEEARTASEMPSLASGAAPCGARVAMLGVSCADQGEQEEEEVGRLEACLAHYRRTCLDEASFVYYESRYQQAEELWFAGDATVLERLERVSDKFDDVRKAAVFWQDWLRRLRAGVGSQPVGAVADAGRVAQRREELLGRVEAMAEATAAACLEFLAEAVGDPSTEQVSPPVQHCRRPPPRWRDRDFVSALYCFWRRRNYVRSARLFADRAAYKRALASLGRVTPDALFEALSHLKKNVGVKELVNNKKVSEEVKACLRNFQTCMQGVLGTNAHRSHLRHVVNGYRHLWGPPLVFTTMNVADTKHPVMKLMYDGAEVAEWRLVLEQDAPDLGPAEQMLERVAHDPVSQALFTDMMMKSFLRHVVGVDVDDPVKYGDSVAASELGGLFGDVQAYFAPVESQGRGGLHAHMSVWVLQPMTGRVLQKLRSKEPLEPEMQERFRRWRDEMLEYAGSTMFECTEEIGRRLGLDAGEANALRYDLEPESQMAREFEAWYACEVEQWQSVQAFAKAHGYDRGCEIDLEADLQRYEGHVCSFAAFAGQTPRAAGQEASGRAEHEDAECAAVADCCCICGQDVREKSGALGPCPGCRPRSCPSGLVPEGLSKWASELYWRGCEVDLSEDVAKGLLTEASKQESPSVGKQLALFALVEGFVRESTWWQRARAAWHVGQEAAPGDGEAESATRVAGRCPVRGAGRGLAEALSSDEDGGSLSEGDFIGSSEGPPEVDSEGGSGHCCSQDLGDVAQSSVAMPCMDNALVAEGCRQVFSKLDEDVKYDCVSRAMNFCDGEEHDFLLWLRQVLEAKPEAGLVDAFIRNVTLAPPEADQNVFATAALRLCMATFCFEREKGVQELRALSQALRTRAAGVGGAVTTNARLNNYLAWRKEPDSKPALEQAKEEFIAQRGLREAFLPNLPLAHARQVRTGTSGGVEVLDADAFEAPQQARQAEESALDEDAWTRAKVRQVSRPRPYVPTREEMHGSGTGSGAFDKADVCSELPGYVRALPYVSCPSAGDRAIVCQEHVAEEAERWSKAAGLDSRRCYVRSHIHRCKQTCGKNKSKCKGPKVCRFGYVHGRELIVLPRRWPKKLAVCKGLKARFCPFAKSKEGLPCGNYACLREGCSGAPERVFLPDHRAARDAKCRRHPGACPADVPVGFVCRLARPGKKLVLPRSGKFAPRVALEERFGGVGRCEVLRYHPDCSSSHPIVQICYRCNADVQCMARVHVLSSWRTSMRRRRLVVAEEAERGKVAARQSLGSPEVAAVRAEVRDGNVAVPVQRSARASAAGGAWYDEDDDDEARSRGGSSMDEADFLFLEGSGEDGRGVEDGPADELLIRTLAQEAAERQSDYVDFHVDDGGAAGSQDSHSEGEAGGERCERQFGLLPEYAMQVLNGRKTVEARIRWGKASRVQVGSTIRLGDVRVEVLKVHWFDSFAQMLDRPGFWRAALPEAASQEAALREYERIEVNGRSYKELADEHGVVAWEICLAEEQLRGKTIVVAEPVEEEYFVPPEEEEEHWKRTGEVGDDGWRKSVYEAFLRMYRDMTNVAHYQTDYSTKANPAFGNELQEQVVGVERLRSEELRDHKLPEDRSRLLDSQVAESGYRTVVRLATAANRASLKKTPEMCSQMLLGHECYASHRPWTVNCKGLVWDGFLASQMTVATAARGLSQLGWDEDKAELLSEIRGTRAEFQAAEGEEEEQEIAPPREAAGVRLRGRGRKRPKALQTPSPEGQGEDDGGELDQEQERAGVEVDLQANRSLRLDWLHRGSSGLLERMGLYHYAMFVNTVYMPGDSVPQEDFFTYRFARSHPDYECRVQKLRVHEPCRVPKLQGFTMPREDDDSPEEQGKNAMFKTLLFRPLLPRSEFELARRDEYAVALRQHCDAEGQYRGPWLRWMEEQRVLADRFEKLECKARKKFTLSDVFLPRGYMEMPAEDDCRPSPAEYLAAITVDVATQLELGAQSRVGKYAVQRARPEDFGTEGVPEAADGYVREDGGVGMEDGAAAEQPKTKRSSPLYPVLPAEAQSVAFCRETMVPAQEQEYYREFEEVMGKDMLGSVYQETGYDRPAKDARRFQLGGQEYSGRWSAREFQEQLKDQRQRFRYRNDVGEEPTPESVDPRDVVSNSNIYWNPSGNPGYAELRDRGVPEAFAYIRAAAERLNSGEQPKPLSSEQVDFLALVAKHLTEHKDYEAALTAGARASDLEAPQQRRMLLYGPGGSGKTEIIKIVRGLYEFMYPDTNSHKALAASNSAARNVDGETVHSALQLGGRNKFSLSELTRKPQSAVIDAWADVKVLILEEVSMISPQMLGGISYRLNRIRQGFHQHDAVPLDPDLYHAEGHMFGRVPLVLMLGDFMQLAPIESGRKRISLLMEPTEKWSQEQKDGVRLFRSLTHAHELTVTHRFKKWNPETRRHDECPLLPDLLKFMRDPFDAGGAPREMPEAMRSQLVGRMVSSAAGAQVLQEKDGPPSRDRYEMAIGWHAVNRMMQYRAAREAQEAGRLLVYVQAVDTCSQNLPAAEYRKALQVVNMTKTGKLMGMLPLYVGMRVRLNAKISARYQLVHDAPGEVKGFVFHQKESPQVMQAATSGDAEANKAGFCVCKQLPDAVLVKFDGRTEDFGLGEPGLVAVEPVAESWDYHTHETWSGYRRQVTPSVRRRQLPLAPERVRTVQTAQGLTMNSVDIYLKKQGNMDLDDYWLHLYVMMSRAKEAAKMRLFSLPDLSIFARGPPEWVRNGMLRISQLRDDTAGGKMLLEARDYWNSSSGTGTAEQAQRMREKLAEVLTSRVGRTSSGKAREGADERRKRREKEDRSGVQRGAVKGGPIEEGRAAKKMRRGQLEVEQQRKREEAQSMQEVQERCRGDSEGRSADGYVSLSYLSSRVAGCASEVAPQYASLLDPFHLNLQLLYGLTEQQEQLPGLLPTACTRGLQNPSGRNLCFVNAAVQCFLRLSPVSKMLQQHAHEHRSGTRPDDVNFCPACLLGRYAGELEAGRLSSICLLEASVRQGHFGNAFLPRAEIRDLTGRVVQREDRCPQGDATDLLLGYPPEVGRRYDGFLGVLDHWEEAGKWSFLGLEEAPRECRVVTEVDQKRRVLNSQLFGCVQRVRKHCSKCEAVEDTIEESPCLDVAFQEPHSACSLLGLLEVALSREADGDARCNRAGCGGKGVPTMSRHRYLEREPAVFAIRLQRGNQDEHSKWRANAACEFEETLTCMRTGPYRLASALLHHADPGTPGSVDSGHYTAICRDDAGIYKHYDDSRVETLTWQDMKSEWVKKGVYMIVYVRESYWPGVWGDGMARTPWKRDDSSLRRVGGASSEDTAPEVPDRSAKVRADDGAVGASSSSSGQQDEPESASSPGISRARSATRQPCPKKANGNGHAEPNSVPQTAGFAAIEPVMANSRAAGSGASHTRKEAADMRTRPTTNPQNQCFINATFTALCASDNARNVFGRSAARLQAESPDTWTRLTEVAAPCLGSAMDEELLKRRDAGAAWTVEQRLAATYMEACRLPISKSIALRLLWHAFYNYQPQGNEHQQEDAHELLIKLTDCDANKSLADEMQCEIWQQLECRKCPERMLHKRATEKATVLSVDLGIIDSLASFERITSVQDALNNYFAGSLAECNEMGILQYDDKPWFCRNPACRSTELPNHKLTMEVAPRTLAVHLKRWRNVEVGRGQHERLVLDHDVDIEESVLVEGRTYNLRSVVYQSGGAEFGHYVCACRYSCDDSKWWYYDDTTRMEVSGLDVAKRRGSAFGVAKAYICIYDAVEASDGSRANAGAASRSSAPASPGQQQATSRTLGLAVEASDGSRAKAGTSSQSSAPASPGQQQATGRKPGLAVEASDGSRSIAGTASQSSAPTLPGRQQAMGRKPAEAVNSDGGLARRPGPTRDLRTSLGPPPERKLNRRLSLYEWDPESMHVSHLSPSKRRVMREDGADAETEPAVDADRESRGDAKAEGVSKEQPAPQGRYNLRKRTQRTSLHGSGRSRASAVFFHPDASRSPSRHHRACLAERECDELYRRPSNFGRRYTVHG